MKKKGFTLVELLAVIVVLAIIALIAVPVVINIIKSAQRGAFKSSAYGILESAKIYYLSGKVQSKDVLSRIDVVQKDENDKYILEYNGEKPESGVIVFDSNGKSALAIKKGTFCASKNYNEEEIKVQDIDKNGKCTINENGVIDIEKEETDDSIKIGYIEDLVDLAISVNESSDGASSKTYTLIRNLDFNDDSSYKNPTSTTYGDINRDGKIDDIKTELTSSKGFPMIGINGTLKNETDESYTVETSFQGIFDGKGYSISNLYIDSPSLTCNGLFSNISDGAEIKNIKLLDSKVNGVTEKFGSLVGCAKAKEKQVTLDNITVTATVNGPSANAGGLIGYSEGTEANKVIVNNITANTNVSVGSAYAGGLIGTSNNTEINNIEITSNVSQAGAILGGVVGQAINTNVDGGNVNTTIIGKSGNGGTGGILGSSQTPSSIKNLNIKYDITSYNIIGGVLGNSSGYATIDNINVLTGSTIKSSSDSVGGLVGSGGANISNSEVNADISVGYSSGGILGSGGGTISDSTFNGNITSNSTYEIRYVGGIAGSFSGKIENVKSNGKLKFDCNASSVGGIVGDNTNGSSSSLNNVNSTMNLNMKYGSNVGGIVGSTNGDIENATANLDITFTDNSSSNSHIGGIAGFTGSSIVNNATYIGTISSGTSFNVAGLIGGLYDTKVKNSYVNTIIKSNSAYYIAGFCNSDQSSGSSIYNSGANVKMIINHTTSDNETITGFARNTPIYNSFSNVDITLNTGGRQAEVFGLSQKSVSNSYITGNITINGTDSAFLHGISSSSVNNSYTNTNVVINNPGTSSNKWLVLSGITSENATNSLTNSNLTLKNADTYKNGFSTSPSEAGGMIYRLGQNVNNSFYSASQLIKDEAGTTLPTTTVDSETSASIDDIKTVNWQSSLFGNKFKYKEGYYPQVYKVDDNGNATTELVPNQKLIKITGTDSSQTPTITTQIEKESIVGETDKEAPTCELNYFDSLENGFTASYLCTDNVEVTEKRHLYDSRSDMTANITSLASLDIKSSSTSNNTVSTWTTTSSASQGVEAPDQGLCYYFRYGAQDAAGNYRVYKTSYCLSY